VISILLNSVARIILPPALLIAAYLLVRGHQLPGGGFVAGVLTAAAFVLQFVAAGRTPIARRLPVRPALLVVLGLALAGLTGLGAQLLGYPFLTSTYGHLDLPLLGHFEASTAFFFDCGVYLVVTGVTLEILLAIEE
jgi:multicomponent K+:H+ antiporter subunit A